MMNPERGLRIVSGRTEGHLMRVDLQSSGIAGRDAEAVLQAAHMTCDKNGIPTDPQKPTVTSGIRLGFSAMTTRGFGEEQSRAIANLIADVLQSPHDPEKAAGRVRGRRWPGRFPHMGIDRRSPTARNLRSTVDRVREWNPSPRSSSFDHIYGRELIRTHPFAALSSSARLG